MDFLQTLVTLFMEYGYWAVFGILILCGFGLPVPEDISLTAGGVISGLGYTNVHIMFLVGMAGVLLGDSFVFWLGSHYGERALTLPILKKVLHPERFDKVREQFRKHGRWVVFFGRFMPGLRMPIFFTAGTSKQISFLLFVLTDGFAALISVPIWVYLGYLGAHNFDQLMGWIRKGQTIIFLLLGLGILGFLYFWWRKKKSGTQGDDRRFG